MSEAKTEVKQESKPFNPADEVKRKPRIMPARFSLAEFQRNDWVANVELGTTIEDIQDPAFWANVSRDMKPYDHIEARSEDGSWIADLLVTGVDRNWARVKLLREYKLTTADVSLTQAVKHEVQWKGPHHKHAVVRLSDQEVVKSGFSDKSEASRWMLDHEKSAG